MKMAEEKRVLSEKEEKKYLKIAKQLWDCSSRENKLREKIDKMGLTTDIFGKPENFRFRTEEERETEKKQRLAEENAAIDSYLSHRTDNERREDAHSE